MTDQTIAAFGRPRKKGRPPKNASQLAAATVEAGAALAAVKRGRGRPRKFKDGELPAAP